MAKNIAAVKGKAQANGVQKKSNPKQQQKNLKAVGKVFAKDQNTKNVKGNKKQAPSKAVPPKKVEAESDDDEDEESEDSAIEGVEAEYSSDAADESSLVENEAEEAEEDENDEEDEEQEGDEEEDGDDDELAADEAVTANDDGDSDDEEPEEAPIAKKAKIEAVPEKKKGKDKAQKKKPDAAPASAEVDENKRRRSVYIRNLQAGTKKNHIKEHFESCGTIDYIIQMGRTAIVVFEELSSVKEAKKLHNSKLNGKYCSVIDYEEYKNPNQKETGRTVALLNKQELTEDSVDEKKLRQIFSKCGEIEKIDLLFMRKILAFITFKEEGGFKKALKLNGTTVNDLTLDLEPFSKPETQPFMNTTIFLQNLAPGTTEEHLRELFSQSGEVERVNVNPPIAYVKFKDTDGFCKAFLLNESRLQGKIIFIEPFSRKKVAVLKSRRPQVGMKRKFNTSKKSQGPKQKKPFVPNNQN